MRFIPVACLFFESGTSLMWSVTRWSPLMLLAMASSLQAQPGLPGVGARLGDAVERLGHGVSDMVGDVTRPVNAALGDATTLAEARTARLGDFLRRNRANVEADDTGQPARAHEVLVVAPDAAALSTAQDAGYHLVEHGELEGLGIAYARLAPPEGMGLATALRRLRKLLPGREISADQIHFASGARAATGAAPPAQPQPSGGAVGIIDGGALPGPRIAAQAGFAQGAPRPEEHAQAIASLLGGAGVQRIYVADVYGHDPAGGGALAIARALGWMTGQHVPVVSISLVGPANPLLARAIAAAQARGLIVTAAVGNDGAAAPPAYPASYAGVVAVTGVDGRGQVLFEAGHATHLDYAAPGADLTAIGLDGKARGLRGTSFAAPLAAARLAALGQGGEPAQSVLRRADAEALRKGARTGRGVLCGSCRRGL
jgi:hypothetical protein